MIPEERSARAQDGISSWFRELGGESKVRLGAGLEHSPRRKVKDQESGLEWTGYQADFFLPFHQDKNQEWVLLGGVSYFDIQTAAILPESGDAFPDQLWDLDLGLLHRRRLANRWTLGINLSVSSPSDQPFYGWDETAIQLNGFLKIPAAARNAWVVFLNYSSNREFLPHVPIPGGGYLYAPSRKLTALIGVPLVFINYRPFPRLTLKGSYFPIHSVSAGGELECFRSLVLFTGFKWVNVRYFRAAREDKADRLFLYEKKLETGCKIRPGPDLEVKIAGAYVFDRFFFEGEGYDDRLDNRVEIDNGYIFSARLQTAF